MDVLRPAKLSMGTSLALGAGSVACGLAYGSFMLVINALILSSLFIVSVLTLSAHKFTAKFPGENSDDILSRYGSLSGFTSSLIACVLLVLILVITATGSYNTQGKLPDFIPLAFGLIAHATARMVRARLLLDNKDFNSLAFQRICNDWKTISRVELVVSAIYLLRILTAGYVTAESAKWIENGGSLIIGLYYFIYSSQTIKSDMAVLLGKPVAENLIFEALSVISDNMSKVCELKGISSRISGGKDCLEISIILPNDISLGAARDIENSLRSAIQEKLPGISVRFHVKACIKDCIYGSHCPVKMDLKKKDIPEKEE